MRDLSAIRFKHITEGTPSWKNHGKATKNLSIDVHPLGDWVSISINEVALADSSKGRDNSRYTSISIDGIDKIKELAEILNKVISNYNKEDSVAYIEESSYRGVK